MNYVVSNVTIKGGPKTHPGVFVGSSKKSSKDLANELHREFVYRGGPHLLRLKHDCYFYSTDPMVVSARLQKGSYVILFRVPLPSGQHKTIRGGDKLIFYTEKGPMYTYFSTYGDPLGSFERV